MAAEGVPPPLPPTPGPAPLTTTVDGTCLAGVKARATSLLGLTAAQRAESDGSTTPLHTPKGQGEDGAQSSTLAASSLTDLRRLAPTLSGHVGKLRDEYTELDSMQDGAPGAGGGAAGQRRQHGPAGDISGVGPGGGLRVPIISRMMLMTGGVLPCRSTSCKWPASSGTAVGGEGEVLYEPLAVPSIKVPELDPHAPIRRSHSERVDPAAAATFWASAMQQQQQQQQHAPVQSFKRTASSPFPHNAAAKPANHPAAAGPSPRTQAAQQQRRHVPQQWHRADRMPASALGEGQAGAAAEAEVEQKRRAAGPAAVGSDPAPLQQQQPEAALAAAAELKTMVTVPEDEERGREVSAQTSLSLPSPPACWTAEGASSSSPPGLGGLLSAWARPQSPPAVPTPFATAARAEEARSPPLATSPPTSPGAAAEAPLRQPFSQPAAAAETPSQQPFSPPCPLLLPPPATPPNRPLAAALRTAASAPAPATPRAANAATGPQPSQHHEQADRQPQHPEGQVQFSEQREGQFLQLQPSHHVRVRGSGCSIGSLSSYYSACSSLSLVVPASEGPMATDAGGSSGCGGAGTPSSRGGLSASITATGSTSASPAASTATRYYGSSDSEAATPQSAHSPAGAAATLVGSPAAATVTAARVPAAASLIAADAVMATETQLEHWQQQQRKEGVRCGDGACEQPCSPRGGTGAAAGSEPRPHPVTVLGDPSTAGAACAFASVANAATEKQQEPATAAEGSAAPEASGTTAPDGGGTCCGRAANAPMPSKASGDAVAEHISGAPELAAEAIGDSPGAEAASATEVPPALHSAAAPPGEPAVEAAPMPAENAAVAAEAVAAKEQKEEAALAPAEEETAIGAAGVGATVTREPTAGCAAGAVGVQLPTLLMEGEGRHAAAVEEEGKAQQQQQQQLVTDSGSLLTVEARGGMRRASGSTAAAASSSASDKGGSMDGEGNDEEGRGGSDNSSSALLPSSLSSGPGTPAATWLPPPPRSYSPLIDNPPIAADVEPGIVVATPAATEGAAPAAAVGMVADDPAAGTPPAGGFCPAAATPSSSSTAAAGRTASACSNSSGSSGSSGEGGEGGASSEEGEGSYAATAAAAPVEADAAALLRAARAGGDLLPSLAPIITAAATTAAASSSRRSTHAWVDSSSESDPDVSPARSPLHQPAPAPYGVATIRGSGSGTARSLFAGEHAHSYVDGGGAEGLWRWRARPLLPFFSGPATILDLDAFSSSSSSSSCCDDDASSSASSGSTSEDGDEGSTDDAPTDAATTALANADGDDSDNIACAGGGSQGGGWTFLLAMEREVGAITWEVGAITWATAAGSSAAAAGSGMALEEAAQCREACCTTATSHYAADADAEQEDHDGGDDKDGDDAGSVSSSDIDPGSSSDWCSDLRLALSFGWRAGTLGRCGSSSASLQSSAGGSGINSGGRFGAVATTAIAAGGDAISFSQASGSRQMTSRDGAPPPPPAAAAAGSEGEGERQQQGPVCGGNRDELTAAAAVPALPLLPTDPAAVDLLAKLLDFDTMSEVRALQQRRAARWQSEARARRQQASRVEYAAAAAQSRAKAKAAAPPPAGRAFGWRGLLRGTGLGRGMAHMLRPTGETSTPHNNNNSSNSSSSSKERR